jgi:hypothetical protein
MSSIEYIPYLTYSTIFPFLVSFEPLSADPEIPQQRAESIKEEKQTQGYEKNGEHENEI